MVHAPEHRGFHYVGTRVASSPPGSPSVFLRVPTTNNNEDTILLIFKDIRVIDTTALSTSTPMRLRVARGPTMALDSSISYFYRYEDDISDISLGPTSYWLFASAHAMTHTGVGAPVYPPTRYEFALTGLKGDANMAATGEGTFQHNITSGAKQTAHNASSYIHSVDKLPVSGVQVSIPNANYHFLHCEMEIWTNGVHPRV